MVLLSCGQSSHRRKSRQDSPQSCKYHEARQCDDSMLGQPKVSKTAKSPVSHTDWSFSCVAPVVAGSLNVPTAEVFKTFQDVIVPERPAVHCSKQVDVDSASTPTTHRRVGRL